MEEEEKIYTEFQVIDLLDKFWDRLDILYNTNETEPLIITEWFEQFKNK